MALMRWIRRKSANEVAASSTKLVQQSAADSQDAVVPQPAPIDQRRQIYLSSRTDQVDAGNTVIPPIPPGNTKQAETRPSTPAVQPPTGPAATPAAPAQQQARLATTAAANTVPTQASKAPAAKPAARRSRRVWPPIDCPCPMVCPPLLPRRTTSFKSASVNTPQSSPAPQQPASVPPQQQPPTAQAPSRVHIHASDVDTTGGNHVASQPAAAVPQSPPAALKKAPPTVQPSARAAPVSPVAAVPKPKTKPASVSATAADLDDIPPETTLRVRRTLPWPEYDSPQPLDR